IAITAFISCVLSLQAAGSRLIYASARDRMLPMSGWLSRLSERHSVPTNSLLVACVVPIIICLYVYAAPDQLPRITAFAVLGIYVAFQAVVLAALRQRLEGWRPTGGRRAAAAGEGRATGGRLEPGSVRLRRQRARAVLRDLRNGFAAQARRHGFVP